MIRAFLIALLFSVTALGQTWNQAESLTNLLTRPPVVGGWYSVKGYRAAGDWGQERAAQYVRGDTTTTNLGNVFNWAGGRLKFFDSTNTVQNAAWWGADLSGTIESSANIQAALDNVASNSGSVLLPPGTYRTTNTLNLNAAVSLVGVSMGNDTGSAYIGCKIKYYGTNIAVRVNSGSGQYNIDFSISDLAIQCTAGGTGIYFGYPAATPKASQGSVRNVRIEGAETGIYSASGQGLLFDRCHVSYCTNGVYLFGSGQVTVNQFKSCRIDSNTGIGVYIRSGTSTTFRDTIIESNGLEGVLIEKESDGTGGGGAIAAVLFDACHIEGNNTTRSGSYFQFKVFSVDSSAVEGLEVRNTRFITANPTGSGNKHLSIQGANVILWNNTYEQPAATDGAGVVGTMPAAGSATGSMWSWSQRDDGTAWTVDTTANATWFYLSGRQLQQYISSSGTRVRTYSAGSQWIELNAGLKLGRYDSTWSGSPVSWSPLWANGPLQRIIATTSANVTIGSPGTASGYGNIPPIVTLLIQNNTAGAMGTATWNAIYRFVGSAPAMPASSNQLAISFVADPTAGVWHEIWRSKTDIYSTNIIDSTAAGRALLTGANAAAQRTSLGLGTSAVLDVPAAGNAASGEVVKGSDTRLTDSRTPTSHTHPATDISDSTSAGRALLTAATAADQRTSLGLGTAAVLDVPAAGDATSGQVVKGSDTRLTDARTPTTHTHPATNISDSTAAGRSLLTAATAADQRTSLGLGTLAVVNDAPSDGNQYVRSNATWAIASGDGGIFGIRVSNATTNADGITNVYFLPAVGSGLRFQISDLGTQASVDLDIIEPGFGINDSFPVSQSARWNINSTTPSAPTDTTLARPQTSGTNAIFVVDVAPTISPVISQTWSNTTAYQLVASGFLNTTNMPYNGSMLRGSIVGRWLNNSGGTAALNVIWMCNGVTNYQSSGSTSVTDSSSWRPFKIEFDLFRSNTNSISGGASYIVGAANAPTFGDAGSLGSTASISERSVIFSDVACSIATNVSWQVYVNTSTANNTNIVQVRYGGLK